jgi:hypothetical protein
LIERTIVPLGDHILAVQYNKPLDKMIFLTQEPYQLHIYAPATGEDITVDLPPSTTYYYLSISPDGLFAVVAHKTRIFYVDLQHASLISSHDVSTSIGHLTLAGNGQVYVTENIPYVDYDRIFSIDLVTNKETLNWATKEGNEIFIFPPITLHQPSHRIFFSYVGDNSLDLGWVDIADGPPYHLNARTDLKQCPRLFVSESDTRLYDECGNVYNLPTSPTEITLEGSLDIRYPTYLKIVDSVRAGKILSYERSFCFRLFNYHTLKVEAYPCIRDAIINDIRRSREIDTAAFNPTGTQLYLVTIAGFGEQKYELIIFDIIL